MKKYCIKLLTKLWVKLLLFGVAFFIVAPINLANEEVIKSLTWFNTLKDMISLIWHNAFSLISILILCVIFAWAIIGIVLKMKDKWINELNLKIDSMNKNHTEQLNKNKDNIQILCYGINNSNKHWENTIKIVESNMIEHAAYLFDVNSLSIKYADMVNRFKDLSDIEFVNMLKKSGFSRENLSEIGVNIDFIQNYKDKLLPEKVMKPYKEFLKENYKYNLETIIKSDSNEHS